MSDSPIIDLAGIEALDVPIVLLEAGREPGTATIAGAHRVSLQDFAGEETERSGRFPLPDHAAFTEWLRGLGIGPTSTVVAVPATDGDLSAAARAWATLRWAGVPGVRVLSGTAADLAGRSLAITTEAPEGAFTLDPTVTVHLAAVESLPEGTTLIDARPAEGYDKAHIPGAVSLPSTRLADGAVLKPAEDIRAAFDEVAGDGPVVTYCGGGVAASLQALALATAGIEAPIYIGSWSEWSKVHPAA